MEYRAITRDELSTANDIMTIAFQWQRRADDKREQGENEHVLTRGAFGDDGRMEACLEVPAYKGMLDGHMVPMQGVGGVASLPEGRRKGHIRGLFDLILREAYDKGQVFSLLYPFSFSFYRQFGYELAGARRVCRFPMSLIRGFKATGSVSQYFPGQDDAEIRGLYRAFIQDRNLAFDREDVSMGKPLWKRWLQKDPYQTRVYTYVWHDERGAARAYAQLIPGEDGGVRGFNIADCAYDSPEALRGLLGFLYLNVGQADGLLWRVPDGLRIHALVPDPYDVKVSEEARGMARVVRVEEALSLLRPPEGSGRYAVAVEDAQLPVNSGVYAIEFAGGESQVTRVDTAPDITLSVPALSQLLIGAVSFDEMRWTRADFTLHANEATLRRAFTRRNIHLEEGF